MAFNRPIPESARRPKASRGVGSLVEAEKMMQIALLLPSAAFIGWLVGAWLDRLLHQSWIGVTGVLFGGISGLVYVVRLVTTAGRKATSGSKADTGAGDAENRP